MLQNVLATQVGPTDFALAFCSQGSGKWNGNQRLLFGNDTDNPKNLQLEAFIAKKTTQKPTVKAAGGIQ